MSAVMIRCPVTGRAVSTAIETEPSVFRKLPKVTARMYCPACGQDHVNSAWLAGELRLVEESRRSQRQQSQLSASSPRGTAPRLPDRPTQAAKHRVRPS